MSRETGSPGATSWDPQANALLAAIVESSDDAIIAMTLDGAIQSWNGGAERIFGYTAEEVKGRQVSLLAPTDKADEVPRILQEIRGGGRVFHFETIRKRKDGERITVSLSVSPIKDANGMIIGASKIARDITEQRRAEAEVQKSEERFRQMADSAPIMVWISGTDKLCTWFNKRWLEFVGRSMKEEIGNGWAEGVHPDDFQACLETYNTSFDARRPFTMEYRLRRGDGLYRWLLDNGVPLHGPDRVFLGYIGSCLDITDRRQAEEERERLLASERGARIEAERAGRIKDDFLATLSHELRTPLQAILGWSRLLQSGSLSGTDCAQAIETIERNARVQTRIIEDLLDMSSIISGKVRLDVQRVDLPRIIEAAIETIRPAAEAKAIHILKALDPQVGQVTGDPNRLQQVMWNLLSNAVKYTPKGGKVHVTLERVNSHLEITVVDTGAGIKPAFLPFVFDRFRQADQSSTRSHGGLGLGLAIVKHLVELHGGSVSAASPGEGRGASFSIVLPLTVVKEEAGEERIHPRSESRMDEEAALKSISLNGLVILAVDDEPDACALIRRVLSDAGAEVITANSSAEGLAALAGSSARRFHLVISDIGMPGEDGYKFIRALRALPEERGGLLPAVALTAFARTEDRTRALIAGYQVHLAKPVDPLELLASVASLTRRTCPTP